MNPVHSTVRRHLKATERRWRQWVLLQHSSTIGAVFWLGAMLFGAALIYGWIHNRIVAVAAILVLTLGVPFVWLVVAIVVASVRRKPQWVAQHLEKAHEPLLDRINTLVFLGEKKKTPPELRAYQTRIEAQASQVLKGAKPKNPFPRFRPLLHLAVCVLLAVATIWFYARFNPLKKLVALFNEPPVPTQKVEDNFEIKPPDSSTAEEKRNWADVRITDPGNDIKATKVDVVPLEIEAASNESLVAAAWATSVNGAKENARLLDKPKEPHYAVYQPVLYLDEQRLSDWDVVSYYAKALTGGGLSKSSEIYFIEIRPFREDLLKMPGGEGGKAMNMMGELTSLMERQRLILRQTHRYGQQPPDDAKMREQDRDKLAAAEDELHDAIDQLYGKLAMDFENQPIGEVLDHLAQAQNFAERATASLKNDFAADATTREQNAHAELSIARKNFQKFVNDNKDLFDKPENQKEQSPVADSEQTEKIAEFRDAEKAALDFLKSTAEKQKELADKAKRAAKETHPDLAKQEEELEKSLEQFAAQNPDLFKDVGRETSAAEEAMAKAGESLGNQKGNATKNSADAKKAAQEAVSKTEELREAFANKNAMRQLKHAHQLKELLEKQAQQMAKTEANPGGANDPQTQASAQAAKEAAGQLKDIVDHTSAGQAFGPQLHDALSDPKQAELNGKLDKAAQAQGEDGKRQAAHDAKDSLNKLTEAFDQSLPALTKDSQKKNPLGEGEEEGFEAAMRELEGLAMAKEQGRPVPQEDRQRTEAMQRLIKAMPRMFGHNEKSTALIAKIEAELKPDDGKPIDAAKLKKLMDEIQNFRAETAEADVKKKDKEAMLHIDLSKLPPEYRDRVERYFQKLSEK